MAFVHGSNSVVYVNSSDFSSYFNNVDVNRTADVSETTTFGKDDKTYVAGEKDGTVSLTGLWDATEDATIQPLAKNGTDFDLFVGYNGQGSQCAFGIGNITNYAVSSPVGEAVATSLDVQSDDGFWNGKVYVNGSDTSTGDMGTPVDNTSSTSNGMGAIVICTAVSGTSPTFDIKVQHSADNVTYADLITFTQVTGATSEVKNVSSGTTINRYLRVYNTVGGSSTPTFTGVVALSRNN